MQDKPTENKPTENKPDEKPPAPPSPATGEKAKTPEKEPIGVEIPTLKDHGNVERPVDKLNKDLGLTTEPDDDDSMKPLKQKNPPNTEDGLAPNPFGEIHWKKLPEHFPVPTESIIPLPTGQPKKIPRIQFAFGTESETARATRVERQQKVKRELERSWKGYKEFAWGHDELSPETGTFRDPFCGWAATLVDSLDTLWIAGLKKEFDEAVKEVAKIDFTYTERTMIPVFETTIRYLGGLLAGYDVSGGHQGKYKILLDKAVELAEILMGIFDTPNRMPILYYNYQPSYVSQPHRASSGGMAELATLSMEFTRLAQLTKQNKYYDAVARITDELVEFQEAGTAIPGLFPTNLDISGCNRTAQTEKESLSAAAQQQLKNNDLNLNPKGFVPVPNANTEGQSSGSSINNKRPAKADDVVQKRAVIPENSGDSATSQDEQPAVPRHQVTPHDRPNKPPFKANGDTSEWDCVRQGITPTYKYNQEFHMGGAQDSAYEYFPKEYLLLGGLEPKYQKLHEDTIKATDEWLMYRPMIKDTKWDILFPAKVTTAGEPTKDLSVTYEMTHLTCFIGGMYGLGGKIFNREKDIETAKKLTDGCVWAYQSTASGIMPEGATLLPCPTTEKCAFNETLWWETLDSSKEYRDKRVAEWELSWGRMAKLQQQSAAKDGPPAKSVSDKSNADKPSTDGATTGKSAPEKSTNKNAADYEKPSYPDIGDSHLIKRDTDDGDPGFRITNQEIPERPQSHEEFIKEYLETYNIPPGYVRIASKSYILRQVYPISSESLIDLPLTLV